MPEEAYDLVRIHCPACGEPLTVDYGHSRQTMHEGPLEIYSLLCPGCAANSTIVINPDDLEPLEPGGAVDPGWKIEKGLKIEFDAFARPPRRVKKDHPQIVFQAHPGHMQYFQLVSIPMSKKERKKWWGKTVHVTVEVIESTDWHREED